MSADRGVLDDLEVIDSVLCENGLETEYRAHINGNMSATQDLEVWGSPVYIETDNPEFYHIVYQGSEVDIFEYNEEILRLDDEVLLEDMGIEDRKLVRNDVARSIRNGDEKSPVDTRFGAVIDPDQWSIREVEKNEDLVEGIVSDIEEEGIDVSRKVFGIEARPGWPSEQSQEI